MDPVSPYAILSAVSSVGGAAFSLSTKLYSFIKATKVVDKSVKALYDEVNGLENVLDTAQRTLKGTVRDHAEDPALSVNGVWTLIENGVQDCRVTVEALDSLLQDVGTNTGTTNPFKKMFKQLKLNLNTDEIVAVRGRLHTHSICLQLALQTLAVSLSCSSTTNIKKTVIPDLEVITLKLDHLASAVARANMIQSSEAQLPKPFQNPDLQDHTQRLRSSAHAVLTTASTVIDAGSTQEGGSHYIPTTFSEFGVPLDNAKRAGIEEWTQNMVIGVEESGPTGVSSDVDWSPSTPIGQSVTSGKGPASTKLDKDPDLLIVKHIFEKAEQNWAGANYPEAEKFFRIGLNRVKKLRASKQQHFNLNDVSLKLAFTRLHQGDLNEARELFESLLQPKGFLKSMLKRSASTDEVSFDDYAYFGLAQVDACQDFLADAELMCQKCSNNWRATTGTKASFLFSKSLQLMASIHQAKGDSAVANLFSELAVKEGLDADETTPYMLEVEQFQGFVEVEATKRRERNSIRRLLSALNYKLSRHDFIATHALTLVAGVCAGDKVGPGNLGEQLTPTSTEIARTVDYLLAEGANGNNSLGVASAERGDLAVVKLLCDQGANLESALSEWDWDLPELTPGSTALHVAAQPGHTAVVGLLCERGANKESEDFHKKRALHWAAQKGHTATVQLLLKRGALVDSQDGDDQTPLHLAVTYRQLDVVKTLCDAGADLEARTKKHRNTPLTLSLMDDIADLRILKLLCKRGADISATRWGGQSALDLARLAGKDVERVLMQYFTGPRKR